jgi:hypothetical protein
MSVQGSYNSWTEQAYQSAAVGTIAQSTGNDNLATLVHYQDRRTVGILSTITHWQRQQ